MNAEQRQNLLAAACAAEQAVEFNQERIGACGTPGCVLGHYAEVGSPPPPFRRASALRECSAALFARDTDEMINVSGVIVREHFGIDYDEWIELFDVEGCGIAGNNGKKAAAYIRDFVARKDREASR